MARVVGDARGEIQGLAEGIALLEEDGPRVQANVRRGSPAAARSPTIEGGTHAWAGVAEVEHHAVAQPFDGRLPPCCTELRCTGQATVVARSAAGPRATTGHVIACSCRSQPEARTDAGSAPRPQLPTFARARPIGGVPRS